MATNPTIAPVTVRPTGDDLRFKSEVVRAIGELIAAINALRSEDAALKKRVN